MGQQQSTPAGGDESHDHWRAEANKHAEKRSQYFEQSQEAFKGGRKAEAKQLSDKGKQEGKLMEEANHKASDAVFHEKNTGRDDHTIDLHGLYVDEAVNRARQAIQQAKREGKDYLVIIVGKGNHSKDHVAKIKPAIEQLAREEKLNMIPNKPNPGCVYIVLDGEGRLLGGVSGFFQRLLGLCKCG